MRLSLGPVVAAALVVLVPVAGCGAGSESELGGRAVDERLFRGPDTPPPARPAVDVEPCPEAAAAAPAAGELPDLLLDCVADDGRPVRLRAAVAGTPTVVALWASWCAPCREELPAFQALHADGGDRVRLLGVLTKDPSDAWASTLNETGVRFPSLRDDRGELLSSQRAVGLPLTLFVRADGTVAHRYVGPPLNRAALDDLVAEHLGVSV